MITTPLAGGPIWFQISSRVNLFMVLSLGLAQPPLLTW
jgi:hypothetical protein